MLIRDSIWALIREQFSEAEKRMLRIAVVGTAICPAGPIIDEDLLAPHLRAKLLALIEKQSKPVARRT